MVVLKKHGKAGKELHAPFPYQHEAFQTLRNLEYGAVFHEQGLGKTKIGIDLALCWLAEDIVDSVIFVTKKSLVMNWQREILFHTNLKPRILGANRNQNRDIFNKPIRFYIAHYECIKSEKERIKMFSKTRALGVVLDEAQKIKNPESTLFKAFEEISTAFVRRFVLTGTPIANRPYDIWAPIYFLDQGKSLGNDFESFKNGYDIPRIKIDGEQESGQPQAPNQSAEDVEFKYANRLSTIFDRIGEFAVRETKDSSGLILPKKNFHKQICTWEDKQSELYQSYLEEARASLYKDGNWLEDNAGAILKKLLRLVQVASNPKIIDESYVAIPGKFDELYRLISSNKSKGEKTLVWSSFTNNVDWLQIKLKEFGAAKIHGKMDMITRDRSVDKILNSDDCFVLVATPGSAKEGLTLTSANHVIFYDRSFSLDDYLQAQDRIHRISQKRICHITTLILPGSIDEWVDDLLIAKELSAKLGLGDIDQDKFLESIDFSFYAKLKSFLFGKGADDG